MTDEVSTFMREADTVAHFISYGYKRLHCSLSLLRQLAVILARVIFGPHPVFRAFLPHAFGVFPAQKWIFHVIGDSGAALGNVHRRIVDMFLAGRSGLATRIVRSEPGG